jgi:hypothetical protein
MPLLLPKGKKRTDLLGGLKEIFRASPSQPLGEVIKKINPILRGWVKYFAIGHSSRCFSYIRSWVETRIRRHLARACHRRGVGWKRWSREWLHGTLYRFRLHDAEAVSPHRAYQHRIPSGVFQPAQSPIFGQPGATVGSTSYGVISSTKVPSRQIQFGLKLRF